MAYHCYVGLLLQAGDQDRLEALHERIYPLQPLRLEQVTAESAGIAGGDITYV